ncbi:MAG: hypothetical protein J7M25_03415 [Deltaproteobacteria bacterium]|nr:hypothetical protein [Deltaproteobacteria bacterium]
MSRLARVSSVAILAAFLVAGCAKDRPPRSYVQPNILAKADLEGKWYYVPTVIDINLGSSVTFVGETGMDVPIIKWDIQENVLYARLAYDRIANTDSRTADPSYKGDVLGAWKIQKQFDIIRDYNATTGEETNTIRESTERPWYQREFIRVDWSENLVSNWGSLMWQRAVTTDPINFFINDPSSPYAPKIERDDNGAANYISIVNKLLITPDMRDLEGWEFMGLTQIPDCFFYGSLSSCSSTEVTVRNAFWKIDPDREYEPLEYTQKDADKYGYFLSERKYYSQDYGISVGGIKWYADRRNLWKESFAKATTDEEAQIYADAQCPDTADGSAKFTCAGDGTPCRCTVNNHKVYILAEVAYRYADADKADSDNAQLYAQGYCSGGAYSCSNNGCTCTDSGKTIYKLTYKSDQLPSEVATVGDEVVCPCDPNAKFTMKWTCDPDRPLPCFYKYDGRKVYYATPVGTSKYPLRFFERGLRPIVYYVNDSYPEEGKETGVRVVQQWSDTFNAVVWRASGCEAAGLKLGQDSCSARPEMDPGNNFQMVVFCPNNPVQEGDPEICGPVGRHVEAGDIRYSQIPYWNAPQQASPLGYGPPFADPLTGEAFSAVANIYGAPLETYAVWVRDIMRMLTDDNFPWSPYLKGYYQQAVVRHMQHQQGFREDKSSKVLPGGHRYSWERTRYTPNDVKRLYANMDTSWAAAIDSHAKPDASSPAALRRWMGQQARAVADSGVLGNGTRPDIARLNSIRDTWVEDMMMTNNIIMNRLPTLVGAGFDPAQAAAISGADLAYGSTLRSKVSPLTWLNLNYIRAIEKMKFAHFANTVMYAEMVPFEEPSSIGLAKETVAKYCGCNPDFTQNPDGCAGNGMSLSERWASDSQCGDKIKKFLKWRIFDPVTVHEMGHNMGLRHNFSGSYDAMNYMDKYWDLREQGAQQRGDTQIKERWQQPRSAWEDDNRITEYQWTSIMDYGGKFNSDFRGLGRYDVAAINYAYAGYTQSFDHVAGDLPENKSTLGTIQTFSSFSWPTPIEFTSTGPKAILPTRMYYDPDNPTMTPHGVVDTKEANRLWRPKRWTVTFSISNNDVLITQPDLESDKTGRILVPYKFCSDEFRNTSLGCNYFDEGADLLEITDNYIQAYENYYIMNNFGRDRYTFGWDENKYTGRIVSRYFDVMQNHMQYYVLYRSLMQDEWWESTPDVIDNFFTTDWAFYTIAVARVFDTFTRVMNVPAPGFYGCDAESANYTDPDGTHYMKNPLDPMNYDAATLGQLEQQCDMNVQMIDGKYWDDTWDFDLGYQWYLKKLRYGQFYDRPIALQEMAIASNNFMGRDTQADFRLYTINFARVYPTQIMALITSIQNNNLKLSAPRICQDQDGNKYVEHVQFSDMSLQPCEALQATLREDDPNITLTFTNKYLDPGHTFTTQLYTDVFGMAMFPMNYSQEFLDKWRVFVAGSEESFDFSQCQDLANDGCEMVTFSDPISHKIYKAVRYPNRTVAGVSVDVSIGANMLDRAQLLADQYQAALTACGGQACQVGDVGYNMFFRAKRHLEDYVMNLEMGRSISYMYNHPSYGAHGME